MKFAYMIMKHNEPSTEKTKNILYFVSRIVIKIEK